MKGEKHFELFEYLEKEQWLGASEIEKLQIERLRKLLGHALVNSKYYREYLKSTISDVGDIKSLKDVSGLPLLRREDLQENYQEILCPGREGVYEDASGGSTGNPVIFYHDGYYRAFAQALELLSMTWMGVAKGDRTAVFWGADRDFHDLSYKERLAMKMERLKTLNSFDVSEASLDRFLSELQSFQPQYVFGYASSLHLAASYINGTGKFTIRPKAVKSSAEMLYDHQRAEIEKAFGTKVYNFYGSREVNNLAAECSSHEGLHVSASGRIIEVVDQNGKILPDGEMGYLAVTDLTNYTFPFVRYLIGDMGIKKTEPCSCGRGYPLLEKLTGRSSDILVFGDKMVHGEYFTHLFYGEPGVRQFQVVQETSTDLLVRIVPSGSYFEPAKIKKTIGDKLGPEVAIKIDFVDRIAPLKSGKYRFTVNKTI
jgi:phenylacetate-CoA ligase